uniref:Uncharacterized protein n=1 Tax=Nelumbo nucifera TaxID=4432 RepID=A0A822YVC6_NELNU|nr:TPA_asm: hypothetical protein HUJ06_005336 [Nelumbo nucifera]
MAQNSLDFLPPFNAKAQQQSSCPHTFHPHHQPLPVTILPNHHYFLTIAPSLITPTNHINTKHKKRKRRMKKKEKMGSLKKKKPYLSVTVSFE